VPGDVRAISDSDLLRITSAVASTTGPFCKLFGVIVIVDGATLVAVAPMKLTLKIP